MVMMAIPTLRSRTAAAAMLALGVIGLIRLPLLVDAAPTSACLPPSSR